MKTWKNKNIKEKNSNKLKRQISIITIFLWVFLITIMIVIVTNGIIKSNALEYSINIPTPRVEDIGNIGIEFICRENHNEFKDLEDDWFIIEDISINYDNIYVPNVGVVDPSMIPYKCTIKLNSNKINEIIENYDEEYKNEYVKHIYNDNFDKSTLGKYEILDKITLYYVSMRYRFMALSSRCRQLFLYGYSNSRR